MEKEETNPKENEKNKEEKKREEKPKFPFAKHDMEDLCIQLFI